MDGLPIETCLAAGYAVFLLLVAAVLERAARHCHRRGRLAHTAGFTYRGEIDAWECPKGQFLTRSALDREHRLVIYRAPARSCNTCALKLRCTSSDTGREIVSPSGSWLESQLGRFHRGLSLTLCVLAGFLLVVEMARSHTPAAAVFLGAVLAMVAVAGRRLGAGLAAGQEAAADEHAVQFSRKI